MNKQKINYIIDILLFIAFLATAVSGVIIYLFLPDEVKRSGQQEFLSITKHTWVDAHDIFGFIFIILTLIHLILHWQWIVCLTKNMFSGEKQ